MASVNRELPAFLCIGAQKAGTTTLADILKQHSSLCIPDIKETKFFLFEEDYSKGTAFYLNTYFKHRKSGQVLGEFDPDYLMEPQAVQRIAQTLGNEVKFIVVLRDPASRAFSHYLMSRKKGIEPLSFTEALEAEPSRFAEIRKRKVIAYLERGRYGSQLASYMAVFPREHFLFLLFETDIVQSMPATIKRIQDFLGVSYEELDTNLHSNEAGLARHTAVRDMVRKDNALKKVARVLMPSDAVRKRLRKYILQKNAGKVTIDKPDVSELRAINRQYFKDEIALTQQLTGLDLSVWNN